jgi:hypothetical protein
VERQLRVAGELNHKHFPMARVRASEFARMDWIIREWGSAAIIEPGNQCREHLRAAIQHLSCEVEQRRIFTHTGWLVEGEERLYLSAGGALRANSLVDGGDLHAVGEKEGVADLSGLQTKEQSAYNSSQPYQVELDRDLSLYRLPNSPQGIREAVSLSLSFLDLAAPRVTYPLWAAMWLAPLRELVNCAFTLWVYGVTGTFKSTLAALALNHYGAQFDDKHLPASFTDTVNRLEQKAFMVKDAPLVIDDFAPQKEHYSHQEYTRTAHRIVRGIGNLSGRGRLSASSLPLTTYLPRSLLIITGEDLPSSQSLMARLFVVEVERGDVDRQRLSQLQAARQRLPHAMAGYLTWLAANWNGMVETLPPRWRQYREGAVQNGLHMRLPEAVASLSLGLEMGLRYAAYLGVIEGDGFQYLLNQGRQTFAQSTQVMTGRINEEQAEQLFVSTLRELMAQGKVFLRHKERGLMEEEQGAHADLLGWYDDQFVNLLPQVSYNRVARHFREQGDFFPVRETTLYKMLKECGALVCAGSRLTHSKWMQGKTQRVLVLKREVLLPEGKQDDPLIP